MKATNEKTQEKTVTGTRAESSEVVRINFDHLKKDLSGFVRGTVEEALNGLLIAEADQLGSARAAMSVTKSVAGTAMVITSVEWKQSPGR